MPKLGVTSDPEPIACVPRQVERSSCAITFMIAERLVGLDQPLWSFGAIVLAFYRDTTYVCGHRVTAERIGLAANSALD
jgi:hypothetical protein